MSAPLEIVMVRSGSVSRPERRDTELTVGAVIFGPPNTLSTREHPDGYGHARVHLSPDLIAAASRLLTALGIPHSSDLAPEIVARLTEAAEVVERERQG